MADQVSFFPFFAALYIGSKYSFFFQFVVIKIRIDEVKGRKAIASGRVEDLNGTVLVEASSTFVQPRYAKLLQSAELRKAMGEPPSSISADGGQNLNPGHNKQR